ncbi:MAG: hypothetical protein ACON4U_06565 [Myxococcota bacterium]
MFIFIVFLSLMIARAEDSSPQQANLDALENLIPKWAAQNAEVQTKVSQANQYLEIGDFFKAFPHWADQPMLSKVFLRTILSQLQEDEIKLGLKQEFEQCLNCTQDVKLTLESVQQNYLQHSQAYITLQRQSIVQLYAALKSSATLKDLKMAERRGLWEADFRYFEGKLESLSDTDSDDFLASQNALRISGQYLATLIELERELVEFLMSRNSGRLERWFSEQFQLYLQKNTLRQHRAAFELASISALVFEDEPVTLVETIQNAKSEYAVALKALRNQFQIETENETNETLEDRLTRTQSQIQSIEALEKEYSWLRVELLDLSNQLLAQAEELKVLIQKEKELSQENHQQEVLLAEKALEEARIQRQQEQAQLDAEIQDAVIQIREEVRTIRSEDQSVRTWIQARLEFYDEELLVISEGLSLAVKRSSLSSDRQTELDKMYLRSDELLNLIRSDRLELEVKSQRFHIQTPSDVSIPDGLLTPESAQSIEQAKIDLEQALFDSTRSREEEVYSIFRRIEQIKVQRRTLTRLVSASAIASARDDFWFELSSEFSEQSIHAEFWLAEMVSKLKSVPSQVLRLDILSRLLRQLGLLGFILGAWFVLRRNRVTIVQAIQRYVQTEWMIGWGDEDEQLDATFSQSTAYIIDCLFAFFLYLYLHDVYPLLALLVLILEGVILWRWRALLASDSQVNRKIVQTLFYFITVFYTYLFLNDIIIYIMSADRLSELISFLILLSLAPICVGTMWMWSETAERNTKHWVEGNRFFHWLDQHLSHVLLRKTMWSCVGLGMLFYQVFIYLSLLIIESTGWFGKSLSDTDVNFTPTEASVLEAQKVFSDPELLYQRTHELQKVHQKIEQWSQSKTNGVIGIIGDLGAGKTTLLEHIHFEPYPKQMLSPKQRLCEVDALHQWLNQCLGLNADSDLVQSVLDMKPSIIVIDRLNFFFLRGMHGYDALYELSRVMQATAHHHCWVVSIHLYSWNFLRSRATPFKTDVFYSTIHIGEMTVQKCIDWSEACAKAHNVTVDFSSLNTRYKTEGFFNQLRKSYWRLLVDNSIKNPSAIRRIWIQSLEYSEAERAFSVHFFKLKPLQIIETLPLTELFILSSILIHGRLTAHEQSQSLNIDPADIIHSCNSLENKGILTFKNDTYEIVYGWYPSVILTLQQKHMLVAS